MKRKQFLFIFLAALLCLAFLPQGVWAKTYRITIGSGYNPAPYPMHRKWSHDVCNNIKKRVEATTKDKIKWVPAWGGAIAKVGEELEAVESGTLKMGLVMTPVETSKLYLNSFGYNIPFGLKDTKKACEVNLTVYRKNKILQDVFKKYNQKWLGMVSYENYDVLTTFPFKTMKDLKGKKIAALGANIPWLKNTGAIAVQSNTGEAYTSFQTGVYDGFLLPLSYAYGPKLYEVAKYATVVSIAAPAGPCWTINLDFWKSLPKKIQDIIWDEAQKFNDAIPTIVADMKNSSTAKMKAKGVTYFALPDKDRREWMEAVKNMPKNFVAECKKRGLPGKQVAESYIQESVKAGYTWPMKYKLD